MNILKGTLVGAALVASVFVSSGASASHSNSQYTEARVSVDLNMRYGPSREYRVIRTIPDGRRVNIIRCLPRRDWCEVSFRRDTGWVSSNYLYSTRNNRRYDRWDSRDWVVAFDFFRHIADRNRDRGHRYDNYRWHNDYYDGVRRDGRRGHDRHASRHDRRRHDSHSNRHHDRNDRHARNNRGDRHDRSDRHDRGDRDHDRRDRGDRSDRHDRDDRDRRHDRRN